MHLFVYATITQNDIFFGIEAYTPQQSCVWILPVVALLGAIHVNMCALINMP